MKKISLLFTLLWSIIFFAQNDNFKKPNYPEIKKKIEQKNSKFNYLKLLKKYNQADSTLTIEEKRNLYYGYIHHPNYSPYSSREFTDKISAILNKKTITPEEYNSIITYTDALLKENPFDINAMNYKFYAYQQLGDSSAAIKVSSKIKIITDAILSSGNGLTKETAYFVIIPTHEYSTLNFLGYHFGGNQSLIDHYDYLSLKENEQNIEGLYFDVSVSLNFMSNLFEKKE